MLSFMVSEYLTVQSKQSRQHWRDFPGGPAVKKIPANAGDTGSIPGYQTKIPRVKEQLSPWATITEPVCCKY